MAVSEHTESQAVPQRIYDLLETVTDPELPVVTLGDLGIIRDVQYQAGKVTVVITPTYTGCPAMDTMREEIRQALNGGGFAEVEVQTAIAPAWTTDWITERGRERLQAYGIAPPQGCGAAAGSAEVMFCVPCPQCGSTNTEMLNEFGATACKALYRCRSRLEPFDYFKPL